MLIMSDDVCFIVRLITDKLLCVPVDSLEGVETTLFRLQENQFSPDWLCLQIQYYPW